MIRSVIHFRVRYAETDRMKFAHHSRYLEWFECGRAEMMRELGYPYRQMEDDGVLLPLVEMGCRFKRAAHYDDLLRLETFLHQLPRARLRLDYRVYREEDNELLAEGFTVHAFINWEGRALKPPKKFMDIIRPYFGTPGESPAGAAEGGF